MFSKFLSIIVFFCFIFNNHALSDKWNINIEGYLSGFKVGESNVIFEINDDKYELIALSNTTGITKLFYPWKQIIEISGSFKNFIVKPLIYNISDIRENKELGFINIKYQNSYPVIVDAHPKPENDTRRETVPKHLLKDTIDPVNSIIYIGFLSASNDSCNHIINVFDGRRRFNLEFIEIGRKGYKKTLSDEDIRNGLYFKLQLNDLRANLKKQFVKPVTYNCS